MKKQKTGTGKALPRIAALGLAGAVLWCGSMPQVSAATLKDLFDEHYYADTYKDLKETYGYDREALWNHYMQHGMAEGRPMNELFDVVKYKKLYADLSAAFEDDWDAYANHFLTVGAKEGRESGTDTEFNAFDYASRYADLQKAFGDNVLALWKHYQTAGAEENREARSEEILEAEREAEAEAEREAAEKEEAAQKPDTSKGYTERRDLNDGRYVITEYDENHMIIKITYYSANGDVEDYTLFQYQNGRQVRTTSYYHNDKLKQIQDYTTNPMTAYNYNYDNDWVLTRIDVTRGIGRDPKLEQRIYYDKDGKKTKTDYYDNDGKKTRTSYYNNDGTTRIDFYDNNGKKTRTSYYGNDGKNTRTDFYDNDGKVTKTNYYDGNGKVSTYIIPEYKDGKIVEAKTYHADGSYGINEYDDNEKLVKYTGYLEDGRISYTHDYTTKPLTNTRYLYNENGDLTSIKEYKGLATDAQLQKETFYDANGNVTYYTVYTYDDDGKLKTTESFNADGSARE